MADDTENQKHYIFLGFGNGVSVSARKASTDDEAKTLAREYAEGVSASEVFIYRIHDDGRDDPKELIAKILLPG